MGKLSYYNDDLELEINGRYYNIEVEAKAHYTYTPERMYMPNGDPGYPDETDFDIDDVDASWAEIDEDGEEKSITPTKEMENVLFEYLYDMDLNDWDDEEEEMDYDAWEDRQMDRWESMLDKYDL